MKNTFHDYTGKQSFCCLTTRVVYSTMPVTIYHQSPEPPLKLPCKTNIFVVEYIFLMAKIIILYI